MKLAIADIIIDPAVSIRNEIDEALVADYAAVLAILPPPVVFATTEGNLLSDGFHRLAAAIRTGRESIDVDLRAGTREQALEHAAVANTKHGLRLSEEEKSKAVLRLCGLHPDWPPAKTAEVLGLSPDKVKRALRAGHIQATVPEALPLPETHSAALADAPPEHRAALAQVAVEHGWTADELRVAVQNVKSDAVDPKYKAALLAGEAEPIDEREGQPSVLVDTIARNTAQARQRNTKLPLWDVLTRLARLRGTDQSALARSLDWKDLDHLSRELPDDIRWLQGLLVAVQGAAKGRKVIEFPREADTDD